MFDMSSSADRALAAQWPKRTAKAHAGASASVEESPWKRSHTVILMAFIIGTTIEAYIYSLPYIAASWAAYPRWFIALLSAWSPLWLLLGGLVAGPLSDFIGRKRTFYFTMGLYALGGIMLALASSPLLLLVSLSILLFSAGGEYQNIMVAVHEMMPKRWRSAVAFVALNFTNLGGVIAAYLSILNLTSPSYQRVVLGITVLLAVVVMFAIRSRTPESIMWLESKGRLDEAVYELKKYYSAGPTKDTVSPGSGPSTWFRIAVGALLGWAYTAGFSMIVLSLGPYFFPKLTDMFIIVSGVVMFASGFFGLVADRFSRKSVLLASSALTVAASLMFLLLIGIWRENVAVFWAIFIAASVFINIYFLAEDTLKSEIWPVNKRGMYTALVRVISLGGSIPVLIYASTLPIFEYFYLGLSVFSVGLVISVLWYIFGLETSKGMSVRIWGG